MSNIFLSENNHISASDFKNPQRLYSPVYNWVWNGEVSQKETDRHLDEFERLGIKSFCIIAEPKEFRPSSMPTLLSPDYLTEAYFEQYAYAVKRAREKGMYVWLYNEGGWPSGGACGRVMIQHPEYARRRLAKREIKLKCGERYKRTCDTLSSYVGGNEITDGFMSEKDCTVTEYFEQVLCFDSPGVPDIPDLTRKEATDCFIKITHERYKTYLQEYFGDTVLTVFSDEPKGPAPIPYREELEKAFFEENGYSARKYLPQLLSDGEMPTEAAWAKINWLDLCSRYFCNNYLLREKEWSNMHGLLFTGHMDGDHSAVCVYARYGHYHILRALRSFDIPGIDAIWRQIFPVYTDNGRDVTDCNNGIFPRYAASAASQTGSRRAVTESMGVYGAGTTFNDMRYVFNYQAVRGINVFNVFGTSYRHEGFNMTGEMPVFTEKQACYGDLAHFNRFAERLAYLASLGERAANVGYYLPINDLWVEGEERQTALMFEKLGCELEDENILFDIIDDDVLNASSQSCNDGIISMGKAVYDTLIVPYCRYMPKKSIDVINSFSENGGKVYVVSDKEITGIVGAVYTHSVKDLLPKVLDIFGDTEKIRLGVRDADSGRLYILFNESDREKTFTVNAAEKFARLYAETGKITRPKSHEVTLKSGESAFFFDGSIDSEAENEYFNELQLRENWYFRKSNRFIIGEKEYISRDINELPQKTVLGEWTNITGIDFSGSGIYTTTFKKPKESGMLLLNLGEVRYSCEVFINGKTLGVAAMSPYCFEVPAEQLLQDNLLEIRVTNTPANEYESTSSFDKWKAWQLSPYHETQKLYHKDSLSGGLMGPVVIRY